MVFRPRAPFRIRTFTAPGGAGAVKVLILNDALDKAKIVINELKDNGLIN